MFRWGLRCSLVLHVCPLTPSAGYHGCIDMTTWHVFAVHQCCAYCARCYTLQDLLEDGSGGTDASGNPILKDIGTYLKCEIKAHFKDADIK